MGRSSNSSHYQLSANRLVSRVHVKAVYLKPSHEHKNGEVVVECLGWNGAKVRCQSQVFELGKGDSFASDKPLAEIIVDVQDSRVILRWPDLRRERSASISSNSTWDEEEPRSTSPSTPSRFEAFPSSPPLEPAHLHSPVSPSPRLLSVLDAASTFLGAPAIPGRDEQQVAVYEDHAHDDEDALACPDSPTKVRGSAVVATLLGQQSSSLSDGNDFSDCDEENDPVVLSFGPAGENLLPRLESFTAASPNPAAALLNLARPRSAPMSPIPPRETFDLSPIKNHVINQLAFSRLHSLPLSTILNNLPATMRQPRETSKVCSLFSDVHLKNLLDDIPCIGEIVREGKDAAGKALEDEFYYMPERDQDDGRRSAVDSGLGKTSLRAVRKQHKVCRWILNSPSHSLILAAILLEKAKVLGP